MCFFYIYKEQEAKVALIFYEHRMYFILQDK